MVSILILLDVLLQRVKGENTSKEMMSFNPYFTGCSTSTRLLTPRDLRHRSCFNPYFTGCSTSTDEDERSMFNIGRFQSLFYWMFYLNRQRPYSSIEAVSHRFNPYFTGCSTSTDSEFTFSEIYGISFNPYFTGCSTSTLVTTR